jgi:hypothetical protein
VFKSKDQRKQVVGKIDEELFTVGDSVLESNGCNAFLKLLFKFCCCRRHATTRASHLTVRRAFWRAHLAPSAKGAFVAPPEIPFVIYHLVATKATSVLIPIGIAGVNVSVTTFRTIYPCAAIVFAKVVVGLGLFDRNWYVRARKLWWALDFLTAIDMFDAF